MVHPHAHFPIPKKPTFIPVIGHAFQWNQSVSAYHDFISNVVLELDNNDTVLMFDPYCYQYTIVKSGKIYIAIFLATTDQGLQVEIRRLSCRGHTFLYISYHNKLLHTMGLMLERDMSRHMLRGLRQLNLV